MSVANAPQVTKVWDSDFNVVYKVTGFYTTANVASNTLLCAANTVNGANNSVSCVLDVVGIGFEIGTANGYVALEYGTQGGNTTIAVIGKRSSGGLNTLGGDPLAGNAAAVAANVSGSINIVTSALDANDCFTITVACRKNNFNNGFANCNQNY